MPRCNLTLKQKISIIELSRNLSTDQLAKKFRVHPTTITRTCQKKFKIQEQASRVNVNFKTIQTNRHGEEHDSMVLEYIKQKQNLNELVTIQDICDKAAECAEQLGRPIRSKRGWWRRFKCRCNIIKVKYQTNQKNDTSQQDISNKRNVDNNDNKNRQSKNKLQKYCYTFKVRESNRPTAGANQGPGRPNLKTSKDLKPVESNSATQVNTSSE